MSSNEPSTCAPGLQCNLTANSAQNLATINGEEDVLKTIAAQKSAAVDGEGLPCNLTTNSAQNSAPFNGEEDVLKTTAVQKSAPVDGEEDVMTISSDASSDGEEDDVSSSMVLTEEEQRGEFFDNLLDALGSRSGEEDPTQGTFAACKTIKYSQGFILKSFHVEGAGELQLPLSAKDVPKLRSVCEHAPFGKGLATMVDTSVRRCWQVDASKLSFPGMPTFLSDVIQRIAQKAVCELGFDVRGAKVEAQLYKLLLYEEGGHFTLHRDTEKVRGMFATLILQLPTEEGYTGGNLKVQHQKSVRKHHYDTKEFDCRMVSDLGFCYTVFFADCLHELRKIESGTRLCLAFNLVKIDSSLDPVHRESIHSKVQKVQEALQPWLEEATKRRSSILGAKLAIPLQHKYTQENLCFSWLKGDDKILAEVFQSCRDNKNEEWLDLHLCLVTKFIRGTPHRRAYRYSRGYYNDSDDDDDYQIAGYSMPDDATEKLEFKNWIDLHDTRPSIFKDLCIDLEKEIVVAEEMGPFDSRPNETGHEGYMGNSGPTLEFWYYTAMLVVWPRLLSFTVACEASFSSALDQLENTVETSAPNFCGQVHQVLCFCEKNILQLWGADRDSKEDSITPRLLNLCSKATALEVVQILTLLAKSVQYKPLDSYRGDKKDATYHIGVRNVQVATAIAANVDVSGWDLVSLHIIDLTKKCALIRSESLAHLAKQLISMGNMQAGAMVANTTFEVLATHIGDLQSRKKPVFTWCQRNARLPEYPDVEEFLKGPQVEYVKSGCFQGVAAARSFAEVYFHRAHIATAGYSAKATGDGTGRNAFCKIQKTDLLFLGEKEDWEKNQQEIKSLELELKKLQSAVPEMNSASMTVLWSGQPDSKRQRFDIDINEDAESRKVDVMDLHFLNSKLSMWTSGI